MKLKLERPLVFFDIEATGTSVTDDQIVEISMLKMNVDLTVESRTRRVKPLIPISEGAQEVHGISMEDLKDEPTFSQISKGLFAFIEGCDLAGYNSNRYDVPMLFNEFARVGINWAWKSHKLVDVGNMWKIANPRTLGAAYFECTGKEIDGAHGAEADTEATKVVMMKMMETLEIEGHIGDEITVSELALHSNFDKRMLDLSGKFTFAEDNETIVFNFGKYRGNPVHDHHDFLNWMASKDFASDTLALCRHFLNA